MDTNRPDAWERQFAPEPTPAPAVNRAHEALARAFADDAAEAAHRAALAYAMSDGRETLPDLLACCAAAKFAEEWAVKTGQAPADEHYDRDVARWTRYAEEAAFRAFDAADRVEAGR